MPWDLAQNKITTSLPDVIWPHNGEKIFPTQLTDFTSPHPHSVLLPFQNQGQKELGTSRMAVVFHGEDMMEMLGVLSDLFI
jgi:hypothetical protein